MTTEDLMEEITKKTFTDHAKVYCLMVTNEHDQRYIMSLAEALDRAYERLDQTLKQQTEEAKRDLEILTGARPHETAGSKRAAPAPGKT